MAHDQLIALGAFLSGVASVLTSWFYVRQAKKGYDADCEKRLQAFRDGLHELDPRPPA